ncbi:hypothetical protein K4F52_005001 [Lecanicillium sp. MT-2017a]|nr:hypothetical protein K4F52_005001 [Lecanicillium sp. MT-2017a]
MTSSPSPHRFPPEYSFPAFFTRQTNLATHAAQLTKWTDLVLSYCRARRIFRLTVSQAADSELFHNKKLDRRLQMADIRELLEHMRREGRAEYVSSSASTSSGGGGSGAGGAAGGGAEDVVFIYWRTPEEWATLVENYVDETAQKKSVLTVYELSEGEGTRGTELHGIDPDVLRKGLNVLVKRGKAQIFGQEDSLGVKFF